MPTDPAVAIRVENLTKVYKGRGRGNAPVVANDGLSITVKRGEIFGLLGPNGSGKTTLVTQLLGLVVPTAGDIWLEGVDVVKNPSQVRGMVGFLPQTGLPMRYVEVERALYYTGRLRGQSERDARHQSAQLIDMLDMGAFSKKFVSHLSGGMLRMTNFAMALMGHPRLLVLDEPTNDLDPHRRRQVWTMVKHLNDAEGVTCVLVTHNVLEAERIIQRVAVMKHGRIVAQGTPGELKLSANRTVRMEFWLKDDAQLDIHSMFDNLGTLRQEKEGHYSLDVRFEDVATVTDCIINGIGPAHLDDFRIAPPSLEDAYLELDYGA
jgi:ABC-type multidrug transport system ATPase subunit